MKARAPLALLLLAGLLHPRPAAASLTTFNTFVGNNDVSTDGCGSSTQNCTLRASVPTGSTVLAAYLYTSLFSTGNPVGNTLDGNAVTYSTPLGVNVGFLQAWRADVTSIVAAKVGSGGGAPFTFAMHETLGAQDGEALVVVYKNGALPTQTVGILDGFSASSGDSTQINFATPLNPAAPGFTAQMFLGDGFSYDGSDPKNPGFPGQVSTITVNGNILTKVAGHCDDAIESCTNGNLITVGSFDDPLTPASPLVGQDHEHYDLAPFITAGDLNIKLNTLNPSHDDNIFLEVFRISGKGGVNAPPPTVPEPGTLALLGFGLVGVVRRVRRR